LAPTSTVVPLADLLVEHRAYLASVGLLLAATVAVERLTARYSPRLRAGALAAVWAALALVLYQRTGVWRSAETVWGDVVAKHPANGRAHAALARAFQDHGDLPGAVREYGLAADLLPPSDVENRIVVAEGLAAALADSGSPAQATAV